MFKIEKGLYVIKPGKVIYDDKKILYASSTVTLIDDDSLILIDTGLREDWITIKRGLEKVGFTPADIDVLVNTHLHPDHIGCNDKFVATKYAHPKEIQCTNAKEHLQVPQKISEKTSVLQTPGHTDGHISIIFDERIVIAGDAIPTRDHYIEKIIPRVHTDAEKAMESILKISEIAEIIVPGHDEPIKVHEKGG